MDIIPGGYILLARKMFESEIMDKPSHYIKLWVWILGKAFYTNGDKLQRGQLLTTISEMQDACGYHVGARHERPTKDQIRNCYEHLANTHMITTTKTTRGLLITICNYEHYQNPKNYEHHGENSAKTLRKPRRSHTIEEECKELKEKPLCAFDVFWNEYPKKKSKGDAERAWSKIKVPSETLKLILDALKWQKVSEDWTKENGKYIPYPATYLNGKRWQDEKPQPQLQLIPALRGTR